MADHLHQDNFHSMVVLHLITATARSSHQALPIMGLGLMICLWLMLLELLLLLFRMNRVRIKTHLSEMHPTI
jgi:hypothetical protein